MKPDIFNIDSFLKEATKHDSKLTLIDYCQRELARLDTVKFSPKSPFVGRKDEVLEYRSFIKHFTFLLVSMMMPAGMTEEDLQRTKPIIEALVQKNELTKEILGFYNHKKQ